MARYQRLWLDEFDRPYEGFVKSLPTSGETITQYDWLGLVELNIPAGLDGRLWTGLANAPTLSYPLNAANIVRVTAMLRDATINASGTPLVEDDTWVELSPATSPALRRYHAGCYYPPGGYVLMFGGCIGPAANNAYGSTSSTGPTRGL